MRIGFWQYPIQFGLVLPLTVVGVGVVLSFLRRPSGPAPDDAPAGWAPRPLVGPLLLVPWWLIPFSLAAMYQPSWPLEDALRPQRMWMVSSQPGLILAAIGLAALVELARRRWPEHGRLVAGGLLATVLVASVPTTLATERLLWSLWTVPRYAHLQLIPDRVPDMSDLLSVSGPRPTILTYEDWSSLVWYETGASVVAVKPPGYAKLAFDPAVFTDVGQDERRRDLASALTGDVAAMTAVADRFGADRIVLGRRGDAVGRISRVAALAAAEPGSMTGATRVLPGNGWDAVVLEPGSTLSFPLASAGEPIELEIRVLPRFGAVASDAGAAGGGDDGSLDGVVPPAPPTAGSLGPGGTPAARRLRVLAGDRLVEEISVPYTGSSDFVVVRSTVTLEPGEPLVLEGADRIAVQSVTGYVPDDGPPPGWRTLTETEDAIVWGRDPMIRALRHPLVWGTISVALLALVAWRARPWELGERLGSADLRAIVIALGLNVVIVAAWAFRSAGLLTAAGRPVPVLPLVPMTAFANTINNVTPGSMGELARLYLLRAHHGVDYRIGAAVVLIERVVAIVYLGASAALLWAAAWLDWAPVVDDPGVGRDRRPAQRLLPRRGQTDGADPDAADGSPAGRDRWLAAGGALARVDDTVALLLRDRGRALEFAAWTAVVFAAYTAQTAPGRRSLRCRAGPGRGLGRPRPRDRGRRRVAAAVRARLDGPGRGRPADRGRRARRRGRRHRVRVPDRLDAAARPAGRGRLRTPLGEPSGRRRRRRRTRRGGGPRGRVRGARRAGRGRPSRPT